MATGKTLRIFVSYSRKNPRWLERVTEHLGALAREGLDVWDDRRIATSADWRKEIKQALADCDVALLLVSASFLNSKFILDEEIPELLQRRKAGGVRVIPVIVEPCAWDRVSWLSPIQAQGRTALSQMGKPKADQFLADLAAGLQGQVAITGATPPPGVVPSYFNTHFPQGAKNFLGRWAELKLLDEAWADANTHIVTLIAPGGTGKTAVLLRWLEAMRNDGWRGAQRVFGWSFYSQGTSQASQASEDGFLARLLEEMRVRHDPSSPVEEKARLLAQALAAQRVLLLLDGLEPLQHPPGPLAGRLRAPGLSQLLRNLCLVGHRGLCVVTSRERLADLADQEHGPDHVEGCVRYRHLDNLDIADGAKLLHASGATKAGKTAIQADDEELREAAEEVQGHALTLTLLGHYLERPHHGDIRKRMRFDLKKADGDGHAFRVMQAYEEWLASGKEDSQRELAAWRLLGYFDRPASAANLAALRAAPAIAGLTEALQDLDEETWDTTLANLAAGGLAMPSEDGGLDGHPLVRQYLAKRLEDQQPEAWREGHRRIYEQLKRDTEHRPATLEGLQPLYQAVAHGCKARLYEKACDEVYFDRILRGTGDDGYFSIRKLGAFGNDLGAVACFFVEPWRWSARVLAEGNQAWLLNQAAVCLRALGRLAEALKPMRSGAEMRVKQKDWKNAAICYGNLSELQLSLGQVAVAVADAEQAVAYADHSGDAARRMLHRTDLADARHQQGQREAARADFVEAEQMQAQRQTGYPLLYSLQGFQYCDLLLAQVERGAWDGREDAGLASVCGEASKRATRALTWARQRLGLLANALDHLTLARCALYADILQGRPPGETARHETEIAVVGLRQAGQQDYLPRALLTRAWLRHRLSDSDGAAADLTEAQQIAERGEMKLHLADIHLTRARLFQDHAELAKARALIVECGYGRRLPELEDAEAAAKKWPAHHQ